jgi:hypothetical protein
MTLKRAPGKAGGQRGAKVLPASCGTPRVTHFKPLRALQAFQPAEREREPIRSTPSLLFRERGAQLFNLGKK